MARGKNKLRKGERLAAKVPAGPTSNNGGGGGNSAGAAVAGGGSSSSSHNAESSSDATASAGGSHHSSHHHHHHGHGSGSGLTISTQNGKRVASSSASDFHSNDESGHDFEVCDHTNISVVRMRKVARSISQLFSASFEVAVPSLFKGMIQNLQDQVLKDKIMSFVEHGLTPEQIQFASLENATRKGIRSQIRLACEEELGDVVLRLSTEDCFDLLCDLAVRHGRDLKQWGPPCACSFSKCLPCLERLVDSVVADPIALMSSPPLTPVERSGKSADPWGDQDDDDGEEEGKDDDDDEHAAALVRTTKKGGKHGSSGKGTHGMEKQQQQQQHFQPKSIQPESLHDWIEDLIANEWVEGPEWAQAEGKRGWKEVITTSWQNMANTLWSCAREIDPSELPNVKQVHRVLAELNGLDLYYSVVTREIAALKTSAAAPPTTTAAAAALPAPAAGAGAGAGGAGGTNTGNAHAYNVVATANANSSGKRSSLAASTRSNDCGAAALAASGTAAAAGGTGGGGAAAALTPATSSSAAKYVGGLSADNWLGGNFHGADAFSFSLHFENLRRETIKNLEETYSAGQEKSKGKGKEAGAGKTTAALVKATGGTGATPTAAAAAAAAAAALRDWTIKDETGETHRKALARAVREQGNAAYASGEFQEATEHYTRAIGYDSTEAIFPLNRAACLLKLKKFAEAEQDCSAALVLDPWNHKAYFRRGVSRAALLKVDQAKADFDQVLSLQDSNPEARDGLKKLSEHFLAEAKRREAMAKAAKGAESPGIGTGGGADAAGALSEPPPTQTVTATSAMQKVKAKEKLARNAARAAAAEQQQKPSQAERADAALWQLSRGELQHDAEQVEELDDSDSLEGEDDAREHGEHRSEEGSWTDTDATSSPSAGDGKGLLDEHHHHSRGGARGKSAQPRQQLQQQQQASAQGFSTDPAEVAAQVAFAFIFAQIVKQRTGVDVPKQMGFLPASSVSSASKQSNKGHGSKAEPPEGPFGLTKTEAKEMVQNFWAIRNR